MGNCISQPKMPLCSDETNNQILFKNLRNIINYETSMYNKKKHERNIKFLNI